jgi:hypothetical protein
VRRAACCPATALADTTVNYSYCGCSVLLLAAVVPAARLPAPAGVVTKHKPAHAPPSTLNLRRIIFILCLVDSGGHMPSQPRKHRRFAAALPLPPALLLPP